jgi:hypothetical protein
MSENKAASNKSNKVIAAVCVVIILVVGLVLLLRGDSSAPSNTAQAATGEARLYVTPNKQTLSKGQELSLNVWANSGDQAANTVEADLSYPTNLFTFEKVDDSNSAFSLAVQASGANGKVTIVRGNTTPLKGNMLVAVVKLQARDTTGSSKITFTKDSKLFSDANKNILNQTVPGSYEIK